MLLLPPSSYKISADPLSFALKSVHAPSWLFIVVSVGALIATASATLAMILKSSRQVYQMGIDHILPKFTRKYDKSKDVAINGILLSSGIGILMLFSGDIYTIVSISNVGLFISYLMVCFAVIHFRRAGKRPAFKSPLYPYLPIISIIALLAFFIGLPTEALLFGIIIILLLFITYYFMREVDGKKPVRIKLFG
jgi:APA family basic amino acid/polyamine antiporter